MIVSKTNNIKVLRATNAVNELLAFNNDFKNDIAGYGVFDYSDCDSEFIADLIHQFSNGRFGNLYVYTYKSKNPWSRAYGYFSPATPDKIFLNTRKLNRSQASIGASICHELIHYIDSKVTVRFGHGEGKNANSPIGKEATAPYWIDNLAEYYFKKNLNEYRDDLPDFNNLENSNIVVYTPWYKRLITKIKRIF
jgi:hypothetical protein